MKKTKTISIEEAGVLMCEATNAVMIDQGRYMLITTTDHYVVINTEEQDCAVCAVCTSIKDAGDEQTRYIYLAGKDEVCANGPGYYTLKTNVEEKILSIIEEKYTDEKVKSAVELYEGCYMKDGMIVNPEALNSPQIGIFIIQPANGSTYKYAGVELFVLDDCTL